MAALHVFIKYRCTAILQQDKASSAVYHIPGTSVAEHIQGRGHLVAQLISRGTGGSKSLWSASCWYVSQLQHPGHNQYSSPLKYMQHIPRGLTPARQDIRHHCSPFLDSSAAHSNAHRFPTIHKCYIPVICPPIDFRCY